MFRLGKNHPNIIFGLNEEQTNVLHQIVDNSKVCYEKQKIKVGKKEREIVKYADNEWGRKARELHRSMNKYF